MEVLFRHTLLGSTLRRLNPSHLSYTEECDPAVTKRLVTIQQADTNRIESDELSHLLSEDVNGREVLVEWYGDDDVEVSSIVALLLEVLVQRPELILKSDVAESYELADSNKMDDYCSHLHRYCGDVHRLSVLVGLH